MKDQELQSRILFNERKFETVNQVWTLQINTYIYMCIGVINTIRISI